MTSKSIANVSLFLGQSNMMNFNNHNVAYPGGWTTQSLNGGWSDIIWSIKNQQWEQYVPVSNSDPYATSNGDTTPCWGIEAPIALQKRSIVQQRANYIFKYCMGNTGLAKTSNFDWSPYSDSEAFTGMCDQLSASIVNIAGVRRIIIDECYWIGQESDTGVQADADAGMRDLPMLARAIRDIFACPNMKFIIARMKNGIGQDGVDGSKTLAVRASQENCGGLPRNAYVNTDDLTASGGHYVTADVVTLGNRMFTASQAIVI